jgi:Flp pilus assembly protein TadD
MKDDMASISTNAELDSSAPVHLPETDLMDLLAFVYLTNGLPDKAAVLLAARNVVAPDDPRTLLALALAQLRSSKPHKALDTLDRLALTGVVSASFHLVRAQALHALGRTDEAASAMRAFVSQRNDRASLVNAPLPVTP